MNIVIEIIYAATIIAEFITGSVANGFIVLVNIIAWVKRRKVCSVDQILTALAISRIALLWSTLIVTLISSLYPDLQMTVGIVRLNNNTWVVANHFSIWLATCLSIFYFLKIANFSNCIFLYLKWRFKKVVSGTLLVPLLFLFVNILVINRHIDTWSDESKGNLSCSPRSKDYTQFHRLILLINTMFTFIPFTVSLMAFLLLIFSLWRHLKNMRYSAKGSRDPRATAHINALQMVVAFLLFYTVFFLSLATQVSTFEFRDKHSLIFATLISSFPSVHSVVLLLKNSKLRQALLFVLWWLRCRLIDVQPMGH
ncbi:taste receptor type 2 member 125-like [Meriones unguiculatus]|uniref:taste receptor type 2 member 125-like n=1 Tax=Meriones unguiculatus TaxID=10047 RepID=UPI000B4F751E|nr:taste receptor type 2 member 125-like [Meriones unguiculatus]